MIARDMLSVVEDRMTRSAPLVEYRCRKCNRASLDHQGERPRCYHGRTYTTMTGGGMTASEAQVKARKAMHG